MRLRGFLMTMVALALAVPAFAQEAKSAKVDKSKLPRVAVLNFPCAKGAWVGWHYGGWGNQEEHISDTLQELMVTALVQNGKGKIRLVERERIQEIRAEQNFQMSGEVDTKTVVKLGKLLGVKYMVTGKVTRFAYKAGGFKTGWGVAALVGKVTGSHEAGAVAGSVSVKKASFTGRLDVRVIDVETGDIVDSIADDGKVDNTNVKVADTGAEVEYDQELVNKVFEPVVNKLAPELIKAMTTAE